MASNFANVSGAPREVDRSGALMDVVHWPNEAKSAEWFSNLREMGRAMTEKADFNLKYQTLLKPHTPNDYVVLRSKAPRARCGASPCPSAYTYEHLFLVKQDANAGGALEPVETVAHDRFATLFLDGHQEYKALPSKLKKTLFNDFVAAPTPDGTEVQVPHFATAVAKFDAFYRARGGAAPDRGRTALQIAALVDFATSEDGEDALDLLSEASTSLATEVAPHAAKREREEPPKTGNLEAPAQPSPARKRPRAPKAAASDTDRLMAAVRVVAERRLAHMPDELVYYRTIASVLDGMNIPGSTVTSEAALVAAWEAAAKTADEDVERCKKAVREQPTSKEAAAAFDKARKRKAFRVAFEHASLL